MFHLDRYNRNQNVRQQNPAMNRFMDRPQAQIPTNRKSFNITSLLQSPKLHQGLNQVQQVLQIVESTAPIIQEYGTMFKNLPAMYRIMKTFKNAEDLFDDMADDVTIEEKEIQSIVKEAANDDQTGLEVRKQVKQNGTSRPKLYI